MILEVFSNLYDSTNLSAVSTHQVQTSSCVQKSSSQAQRGVRVCFRVWWGSQNLPPSLVPQGTGAAGAYPVDQRAVDNIGLCMAATATLAEKFWIVIKGAAEEISWNCCHQHRLDQSSYTWKWMTADFVITQPFSH